MLKSFRWCVSKAKTSFIKEEGEGSLDEEGQELQDMVAGNRSCNSERSFENCEAGKGGALDGRKLDPLIVPKN